jgi:Domain of Unknown Function (DUF1080)
MAWRILAFAICVSSCLLARAEDNALTQQERKEGWQLLFDGKTTDGWMTADEKPALVSHVQDGALNPHPRDFDYLLLYKEPFENFVLSLDFKVSPDCNSGVIVRIWPLKFRGGWDIAANGLEVAIDDRKVDPFHSTGAIYDLVKPLANAAKPTGEWNHLEVTCDHNRIKSVLNGQLTAEINLDEWTKLNERPDGSRHKFDIAYKDHPRKGYIGLQDHGSDVWYRNIKLKRLE